MKVLKAVLWSRSQNIFMVEISLRCTFQQWQPIFSPFLPQIVLPPVDFLWTQGREKKWNLECHSGLFLGPTKAGFKFTPSDVCSNSTFTPPLAFHLFSSPKRDVAQASAISSEDNLEPKISFFPYFILYLKTQETLEAKITLTTTTTIHTTLLLDFRRWTVQIFLVLTFLSSVLATFISLSLPCFFCSFPFLCCANQQQILKYDLLAQQKELSSDSKLTSYWAFRPSPLWTSSRICHSRDTYSCL